MGIMGERLAKASCKTTFFTPRLGRFFLASKRTFFFFGREGGGEEAGGLIRWMLHIGTARHPGPGPRDIISWSAVY